MPSNTVTTRFPKWITRPRSSGSVIFVHLDVAGKISVRYNLVKQDYQDIYAIYRLDERTVPKRYKNLVVK